MRRNQVPVEIIQTSKGGKPLTRKHRKGAPGIKALVTFTRSYCTCYWGCKVLKRYSGSHWSGGNYVDEASGDAYIVMQKKEGS